MTEVRLVREEESARFLEILCTVFGLDLERARSVFFTEPLYSLRGKWGLFEDGVLQSILTTTPLEFGFGPAIGIAGVATMPNARGRGLARQLLTGTMDDATARGVPTTLLFAHDPRLYDDLGFETLDTVIRGKLRVDFTEHAPPIELPEVRAVYQRWSDADTARLRRDDRRWESWNWTLRCSEQVSEGYIVQESTQVREAIGLGERERWPAPPDTDWVGLATLTEALQVPLRNQRHDLLFMGKGAPTAPVLFMTDQF